VTYAFATQAGAVVDSYTGGKKMRFAGAPDSYLPFRTNYVLAV
jgi:hypothetical protein